MKESIKHIHQTSTQILRTKRERERTEFEIDKRFSDRDKIIDIQNLRKYVQSLPK